MKLKSLIQSLYSAKAGKQVTFFSGRPDGNVLGIFDNSKKVKPGGLFVAIKGLTSDGHDFIAEALANGALAVVTRKKIKLPASVSLVVVKNPRKALAFLAAAWYGNPSEKLTIIGITGTKGKTTTALVICHLLKNAKFKVGVVTSISAKIGNKEVDTGFHVTSPEPLALHSFLEQMVKAGLEYVVLEVTSHALDQDRFAGIDFNIGVLTNISHEHLDYHKTLGAYIKAKQRLFDGVDTAVLNFDDVSFAKFKKVLGNKTKLVTYSQKNDSTFQASDIKSIGNTHFKLKWNGKTEVFETKLLGDYNVGNILASIAVANELGISMTVIKNGVESMPQIPGRLEEVKSTKNFKIFIDFAHTPNSLESVLGYLQKIAEGRVICVFGSAGERDSLKRPIMGGISGKLAEVTIITAEDPRSEKVENISAQIAKGASKYAQERIVDSYKGGDKEAKHVYLRMPERGAAIHFAIAKVAQEGDIVVVCGKSHEKSMAYNGIEYAWSDKEAISLALKGRVKVINYD